AEIVLLRKWCHRFCPLGALLGLMARLNRTFRPTVAAESCLHCSGASCSRCADVCPEGIDLHHPEASVSLAECTKCGECRDACPAHAISFRSWHARRSRLPSPRRRKRPMRCRGR
ncbi:MAG: 4Fe-4S binding protein, partial [Adlercreutzia sp.]